MPLATSRHPDIGVVHSMPCVTSVLVTGRSCPLGGCSVLLDVVDGGERHSVVLRGSTSASGAGVQGSPSPEDGLCAPLPARGETLCVRLFVRAISPPSPPTVPFVSSLLGAGNRQCAVDSSWTTERRGTNNALTPRLTLAGILSPALCRAQCCAAQDGWCAGVLYYVREHAPAGKEARTCDLFGSSPTTQGFEPGGNYPAVAQVRSPAAPALVRGCGATCALLRRVQVTSLTLRTHALAQTTPLGHHHVARMYACACACTCTWTCIHGACISPPRPPPRRTHVCMCMCMHMYMDMYTWSMYISPSATTTSHACMHVCACTHIVLTDPAPRPPPPLARRPSTADPPAAPSRPSPATSSSHHTATLAATRPLCRRLHLPALP